MRVYSGGGHILTDKADLNITLTNSQDLVYTGPIYMGSDYQAGEVVYDTGSGWLTISSTGCYNCGPIVYNPSLSSSSVEVSDDYTELKYGSATLYGYFYEDTVCLTDSS
jgi:hypothetical protein